MVKNKHIVLVDGCCNLCNGLVQFITKRDTARRFDFFSLQSETGHLLMRRHGLNAEEVDTVVYIIGERYFLRSSAVLAILKDLGGVWRLFYILIIVPKFIRDLLYDVVARSRYAIFGKRDFCDY